MNIRKKMTDDGRPGSGEGREDKELPPEMADKDKYPFYKLVQDFEWSSGHYIEVQYNNQVFVGDIEEIAFPRHNKPTGQMISFMKNHGIKYRILK
jgi:hypothetical protein